MRTAPSVGALLAFSLAAWRPPKAARRPDAARMRRRLRRLDHRFRSVDELPPVAARVVHDRRHRRHQRRHPLDHHARCVAGASARAHRFGRVPVHRRIERAWRIRKRRRAPSFSASCRASRSVASSRLAVVGLVAPSCARAASSRPGPATALARRSCRGRRGALGEPRPRRSRSASGIGWPSNSRTSRSGLPARGDAVALQIEHDLHGRAVGNDALPRRPETARRGSRYSRPNE